MGGQEILMGVEGSSSSRAARSSSRKQQTAREQCQQGRERQTMRGLLASRHIYPAAQAHPLP